MKTLRCCAWILCLHSLKKDSFTVWLGKRLKYDVILNFQRREYLVYTHRSIIHISWRENKSMSNGRKGMEWCWNFVSCVCIADGCALHLAFVGTFKRTKSVISIQCAYCRQHIYAFNHFHFLSFPDSSCWSNKMKTTTSRSLYLVFY